ncbi:hypothetical protein EDC96DRAFT_484054 [Choanephora cucurbitarum]|nr:hypothetical protein EDC96DRAFT_484054 [Choanephora cucurbitarum]
MVFSSSLLIFHFHSFNMSTNFKNLFVNDINTLIVNNKRSRSPTPEPSTSSVSSCDVKRVKKINYFKGLGQKEWAINEKLIVDNVDITTALHNFRAKSIKAANQESCLNSLRVLSLSHIFPFDKHHPNKCISSYLKKPEADALKLCFESNKPKLPKSSVASVMYCKNIADDVEEEDEEEEDNQDEMSRVVKRLVTSMTSSNTSIAESSEATFTGKYLKPVVDEILIKNKTQQQVYGEIDTNYHGYKPDMLFGAKRKRKDFFFFFVEIKRPGQTSKYQPEDDLTKLLKQMKHSVDEQLFLGVKAPKSLGLLVEGFDCFLYQMIVLEDGIYFPMMIKSFCLVRRVDEMIWMPTIVECLTFVKVKVVIECASNLTY